MLIGLRHRRIGQHHRDDRREHQEQTACRLLPDKFSTGTIQLVHSVLRIVNHRFISRFIDIDSFHSFCMHWSACFSLYMIYYDMKRGNFNFFHLSENGIQKAPLLLQECFVLVNLPIPHTNLTVLVSQDFFTVRIRREVA